MIPAIRETDRGQVRAVASRSLDKAKAFAEKLNIPKAYGSYEELLSDPDVDAIYNPLPVSLHADWSIKAAEAGKPVLCEKPLALNSREAEQMIEAFASRNLLLSESLMYRYHALTLKIKEMLDDGCIGRPVMMHAMFNALIPEKDIRRSSETGGGAMLDLGCYCLSVQRYLAGEEPDAVTAVGHMANGVDVNISGAMRFPSGLTGHFGCSLDAAFDCRYEVWGSEGRILSDMGAMCAWPGQKFIIKHWAGDDYKEIEVKETNPYQRVADDFQAALLDGKAMDITLKDTLQNMKTLDAALHQVE